MITKKTYGHSPSHIPTQKLALGWLKCVHRFMSQRGTKTYWHSHAEDQILCSLFGEFAYEFKNRARVNLSAGQYIVIPANTPHRIVRMQEAGGKRVELLLSRPRQNKPKNGCDIVPDHVVRSIVDLMRANPCQPMPCRNGYLKLFAELYDLADRGSMLSDAEIALARVLASMILLKFPGPSDVQQQETIPAHTPKADVADKILAFIEAHYKEHISIKSLCAYGGYSRSATIALIENSTGKTPCELISCKRLEEACQLLSKTNRSISDIAQECGFTSARYFNYAFRQELGTTPSKFRRSGGARTK